ncbi:ribonuclease H-like domain-containing protein [Tanacetum coccineum]
MKRPTKGYSCQEVALFPTMLNISEPSTSPSRITSSPSHSHSHSPEHSPDHTIAVVSFPSPTQPTQPSPETEHHIPTPHDLPLHVVHSHGSDEGSLKLIELTNLVTKLSERIGVLEDDLKKTKLTYSAAVTKLILRGRKLSDAEVQEKACTKTEPIIQEVTPTEVIQDQGSSEKGNSEVSTAGATKGTASEVPVVSTAEENISTAGRTVTYRRRSEEERTRKDKGKAIMTEPEPKKKSMKEIEQERLSFAEAIRLQEQMNEKQRAQIARDEEIARQWDEEERQRAMSEAKSTKQIDWNDPSVIRYHALKMKPKTVAQARRNMVKYLKNQGNYKISDFKGMSYNEIRPIFEKKSLPRKSTRSIVKRQKIELDNEKEDLKVYLDIVPREDVESLSTSINCRIRKSWGKYLMLRDRKFHASQRKGISGSRPRRICFNCFWGDLHTLFEPDKEDEIWRNQHEFNVISWSLCDFSRIHILLMRNGIAIHMLTEKKYPLSQEMLSKMLSKRLEVDHESSQAYELLKFIRSQVQKIDQGLGSTSGIRACALRNFDLEVMELENTQNNALAKLPMLKLGEDWVMGKFRKAEDKSGMYFGYKVRSVACVSSTMNYCSCAYDYLIGTFEHGHIVKLSDLELPSFRGSEIDMSDLQTYISTTNSKSDKAVKLKAQAANKPERIQLTTKPNDSKALILASQFGCLEEILVVVSMLSVESIFYVLLEKLEEEVDIIKKTENQAKMTKLSMEWKRLCKIKAKVQKCQSQSQY